VNLILVAYVHWVSDNTIDRTACFDSLTVLGWAAAARGDPGWARRPV